MKAKPAAAVESDLPARSRLIWLSLILGLAVVARLFRLDWGLPDYEFPDSFKYFVGPAARMARGDVVPREFIHPPLLVYILGVVDLVWSMVTGQVVPVAVKQSPDVFYQLTMLGRVATVLFAVSSVGVLYLLTRRLVGTRPALLAAAAFGLSPLHVLESHRVNPDGPALFWALLAAHLAVIAMDRRSKRHLYAAFLFAGAAAATKYTGLVAITVPIWVALRWSEATWAQRFRLCVAGGLATAATVALVMSPVLLDPEAFMNVVVFHIHTGFRGGLANSSLDWLSSSYGRFFAALLPYAMGWAVYLLALVGLGIVTAGNRRALGILAAAGIPFLLVQGGSFLAPPRWTQPLVPYLCLCAGVAMDRLWRRWPGVGIPLVLLALGYTGMLTASQCVRLGLAPQRSLSSWMGEQANRQPEGRRLVVGYPSGLLGQFDPLAPMIRETPIDIVYLDVMLRASSRSEANTPGPATDAEAERALEFQRNSLERLDFLVLPSMVEAHIPVKLGPYEFYERVVDGSLGFHLEEEFRTRFFTENLYVWADQSLNTHMATGINGYKVFARTGRPLNRPAFDPFGPSLSKPGL